MGFRGGVAFSLVLLVSLTGVYAKPLRPVLRVDSDAFEGLWYEIAVSAVPKFTYEYGCICTTFNSSVIVPDPANLIFKFGYACERFGRPSEFSAFARPRPNARVSKELIISPGIFSMFVPQYLNEFLEEMAEQYSYVAPLIMKKGGAADSEVSEMLSDGPFGKGEGEEEEYVDEDEIDEVPVDPKKYKGKMYVLYELDKNGDGVYDLLVVSCFPAIKGLWFYSRTPTISQEDYDAMVGGALAAGVNDDILAPGSFYRTDQSVCILPSAP